MMVLRRQGHTDRAWFDSRSGSDGSREPDESDQQQTAEHTLILRRRKSDAQMRTLSVVAA